MYSSTEPSPLNLDRKSTRLNSSHSSISYSSFFFFLMIRRPPRSPLFPSTTLFRSNQVSWLLTDKTFGTNVLLDGTVAIKLRSEEHTSELQSQFHLVFLLLFFFNDPPPPEISPLPLHDALPI